MKKNILILTDADVRTSSIELHQIKWLQDSYMVDVVSSGIDKKIFHNVNYYNYTEGHFFYRQIRKILLLLKLYKKYTFNRNILRIIKKLKFNHYDIIIVHHLRLLPIANIISNNSKIIFHAHEYYLNYNNDWIIWRLFISKYWRWISKKYLSVAELIITVNKSIAELYKKDFSGEVQFLHNLVPYEELFPNKVETNNIRIIHHGLASKSRKIELMIEMAKYLDARFSITLVLLSYSTFGKFYLKKLIRMSKGLPNVIFAKPVDFNNIAKYGNTFDIGLFFMPPSNLNEEMSLGHKFFQYIQSRLCLVVSPLPEMKNIVEEYKIGIVSDNYNPMTLAEKLNSMSGNEIEKYKFNSHLNAKKFDINNNKNTFINYIEKLLK